MIFLPYNLYSFINFKEKMFKQLIFILLFGLLGLSNSWAQEDAKSPQLEQEKSKSLSSPLKKLSIQTLPAFYLNTWSLDLNYRISKAFIIGLSYGSTLGNNDGGKQHYVVTQDYTREGMRLQLSGNYFFGKKAPKGFYTHLQVSYNTIVYYDGTTRPFSLTNHRKDVSSLASGDLLSNAKKVDIGIGVGYQAIVIPNYIIANILIGIQGNQTSESTLFMNVYIRPTIGFIF